MEKSISNSVGMRDIAERCHVGKTTVSRALQGDPRVKPSTAQRILAVAAEMGYDPCQHLAARKLALRKYGRDHELYRFAMVLHKGFYEVNYFSRIFIGIAEKLSTLPCTFVTSYMQDDPTDEESIERLNHLYRNTGVDGYITISHHYVVDGGNATNSSVFAPPAIVCTMEAVPGYAAVTTDDEQGAYLSARHLLQLGHRHLLQFTRNANTDERQDRRKRGVYRALSEWQLDPKSHLHFYEIPSALWMSPEHLMPKLSSTDNQVTDVNILSAYLHAHPEISGLLAINDTNALAVWYGLQQLGWQIPEDLSIVGFDDTDPKIDHEGRNVLTSIRLPLVDVGREAARVLYGIRTGDLARDTQVMLPVELMIRQSTEIAKPR